MPAEFRTDNSSSGASIVASGTCAGATAFPPGIGPLGPRMNSTIDKRCFFRYVSIVLFEVYLPSDCPFSEYAPFSTASASASRNTQHTALTSTTSDPGP